MADLVIRGMEMPKTCQICRTAKFDRIVGCEEWDRLSIAQRMYMRSETCPLISLPEGHGRLIDADELMKKLFTKEDGSYRNDRDSDGWPNLFFVMTVRTAIEDALTIVPAEGDKNETRSPKKK